MPRCELVVTEPWTGSYEWRSTTNMTYICDAIFSQFSPVCPIPKYIVLGEAVTVLGLWTSSSGGVWTRLLLLPVVTVSFSKAVGLAGHWTVVAKNQSCQAKPSSPAPALMSWHKGDGMTFLHSQPSPWEGKQSTYLGSVSPCTAGEIPAMELTSISFMFLWLALFSTGVALQFDWKNRGKEEQERNKVLRMTFLSLQRCLCVLLRCLLPAIFYQLKCDASSASDKQCPYSWCQRLLGTFLEMCLLHLKSSVLLSKKYLGGKILNNIIEQKLYFLSGFIRTTGSSNARGILPKENQVWCC